MNLETKTARHIELKLPTSPASTVDDNSPSAVKIDLSDFTQDEIAQAKALVPQINILDFDLVTSYGSEAQKALATSSDKVLKQINSTVTNSVGQDLDELLKVLEIINLDTNSAHSRIGSIVRHAINTLVCKYREVEKIIAGIVERLKEHRLVIKQDIDALNRLKTANERCYKTISLYIYAGQTKIEQIEREILPPLKANASRTEKYQQMSQALELFRNRISNLIVSRNICLQNATQIRLLLQNDTNILEKISIILSSTIPLWKNQISISLGLADAEDALTLSSQVMEGASQSMQAATGRIKELSGKVARQSKRKDVDFEALNRSNAELLEAISSAKRIQQDSIKRRQDAEVSLRLQEKKIKDELKKTGGAS